jgi:predicted glycogen debranching enzyme
MLIRYTLLDAHSPTKLRFRPFLAFRNVHLLSKANIFADTGYTPEKNGISMRLYHGYSRLFMQLSDKAEYVHVPDWYYNIEYIREQERGYDYAEDLLAPGFFEVPITKGESIIFTAGLEEINPGKLKEKFNKELRCRIPRNSFENCLINSAQQFIVERNKKTEIIAGFHWYGRYGRDTFMSLPGLTLEIGNVKTFRSVMNTMVSEMDGPLFPNSGYGIHKKYNSVDAPLWFFWAVQKYIQHTADWLGAWRAWGTAMEKVISGFIKGAQFNISVNDLGLVQAGDKGLALTWMDAIVDGKPVTPRTGMAVEINALWYNALRFYRQLAEKNDAGDQSFMFNNVIENIESNFIPLFWNAAKGCLYDVVLDDKKDDAIRPNQLIATSLPFTLLTPEQCRLVLGIVKSVLLTPRGIRSLSPHHPDYKGEYFGNQPERDRAIHQGTVWPWLIGHFAEGWLKIYDNSGRSYIENIYQNFEDTMKDDGIGTISEVYEGNPPHRAGGSVSQARSVAELLRVHGMLRKYNK